VIAKLDFDHDPCLSKIDSLVQQLTPDTSAGAALSKSLGEEVERADVAAVAVAQHPPLVAVELLNIAARKSARALDRVLGEPGHLVHEAEHLSARRLGDDPRGR